jgi:hypothetical protein
VVAGKPLRRQFRSWRHKIRNQKKINNAVASGNEIVLLHQMGKVGSSSLRNTLELMKGVTVFQTHWCNDNNLNYRAGIVNEDRRISNRYGDRDHFGSLLRRRIIKPNLASKVITMVRDPIARNVSSYFQHLDEIHGVRRAHTRVSMDNLLCGFIDVFEHDEPLSWFDTEILEPFGIDIFAEKFNRSQRWSLINAGAWSVLVMRADLPDTEKQAATTDLLDRAVPVIHPVNVGEQKIYASVYREFKTKLQLSPEYLDRFYNAPVTQHFYESSEIEAMRANWSTSDHHASG